MHIQTLIHSYGYMGVFLIIFIEMLGIPFPAETTLILSGIMWGHGVFKLLPLLLAANIGNILGSSGAFGLGYFLGRPIIVRFGKIVGLTNERFDRGNQIFSKYQVIVVLFGKFIAGIRVLIPYLAGINKMRFLSFSIYNAISSVLWTTAFIVVGKYIGKAWSKYDVLISQYRVPAVLVLVVLVGVIIGLKIRQKRKVSLMKAQSSESSRLN